MLAAKTVVPDLRLYVDTLDPRRFQLLDDIYYDIRTTRAPWPPAIEPDIRDYLDADLPGVLISILVNRSNYIDRYSSIGGTVSHLVLFVVMLIDQLFISYKLGHVGV